MERSNSAKAENVQLRKLSRAGGSTPNSENVREQAAQRRTAEKSVQEIFRIFHKWGIHTLGQLAALDKEEIRLRLGPEAVRMWERANGKSARLLKLVRSPEIFAENFEFEREIETAEPLYFVLRRLLEQLTLRLNAIYLLPKELTLTITFASPPQARHKSAHRTDSCRRGDRNGSAAADQSAAADKQRYQRVFKMPEPTNDVDVLFRMLGTHLENFRSEHPIVAVALQAQPIKPASQPRMLSGFATALRNPHQLYETLARLNALVGADRVGRPVLEETHRPDAFRIEPFAWESRSIGFQPASRTDSFRLRTNPSRVRTYGEPVGQVGVLACDRSGRQDARQPHSQDGCATLAIALRRFRPAAPASVFVTENVPAHVHSEKFLKGAHVVAAVNGPYFASGNWWDEKSWAQAEWDLQLEEGVVCRSYQTGEGAWVIEGIYD